MLYRLLGIAVWKGGKLVLRRKYGSLYAPKALLGGGLLAVAGGVGLLLFRRHDSDD
jgi:hypothetical protein